MWNISLPDFRILYVILLKGGIHKIHKVGNDNNVLNL